MVGMTTGSAPYLFNTLTSSPACSCALVTRTRHPKRGFFSNQLSLSLSATTSPTTVTTGGFISFCFTRSHIFIRVPVTVICFVSVPHLMTATGVDGDQPFSRSLSTMNERFFHPMTNTRVPRPTESLSQAIFGLSLSGASCPVIMVTEDERSLCVSGMPAYAGTAVAELTPGITSKGISYSASSSASSPPLPNIKGSPPLSLTTVLPSSALWIMSLFISSCGRVLSPPFLPA